MKTLRMKVVPRPEAGNIEVLYYSCPDVKNNPQLTLKHVQKTANDRNVAFNYFLVSDLEYHAVRGAREWRLTEPGDTQADYLFRNILVRAGFAPAPERILNIGMTGEDDVTVIASTGFARIVIDTKLGGVAIEAIRQGEPIAET